MQATQYKISTITATGSINADVNLELLFDNIPITPVTCDGEEGVLYAELGQLRKGVPKKNSVRTRKTVESCKKFDNQLTLEYRLKLRDTNNTTVLNCKIFKNGNVQMTGVKYVEQGNTFVDKIIELVRRAGNAVQDTTVLENKNYSVRMINCDYKVGFCIKRDALFKVMMVEYGNMVSFEPCIYPGVKIQYMWNVRNLRRRDGICRCAETCIQGKGNGHEEGKCKKITVAVFQSGCVIITGAQTEHQIKDTYEWINNIIFTNKEKIEKRSIAINESSEPTKKILLPKNKIISLRPLQDQLF